MALKRDKSFGNRYTKAGELVECLKTFNDYAPGLPGLEPDIFKTFLLSVDSANSETASKLSALQTIRDERSKAFKDSNGLLTRCSRIRDYVAAIHPQHKRAQDYKKIQKTVASMRGGGKKRKSGNSDAKMKIKSTSERSFGSLIRMGKDILEIIKTVPGYNPNNAELSVPEFESFLTEIDNKNSIVSEKLEAYDNSVEGRRDLYRQLAEKVSKIKLAVSSQYGKKSNEYKDVVKY